ncbi:ABC transporter permease subunit [Nocardia sp. NPDC049707]|uniref:ABC transporter permease n=1 Tax=Nocardia sp. NPDC049707 TaxID=3154735 RepID=UPI003424A54B
MITHLAHQATTAAFWTSVGMTLEQWLIGFGLSVLIAVPIGLIFGTVDPLWVAFRPTVEFLRPVPGMALIPLTVLIWGLSIRSVVFLTIFGCVWSLILASMYGAHGVDGGAKETARSFKLTPPQQFRWVTFPSALPYIATGLRIASSTALMIVVSAEVVVGVDGIGHDIAMAQTAGDYVGMYCLILTAGAIGTVVHIVFSRLERRCLHWHPSQRGLSS